MHGGINENVFYNRQVNTERAIRHAIQERLPIVVVINKVSLFLFFLSFHQIFESWILPQTPRVNLYTDTLFVSRLTG